MTRVGGTIALGLISGLIWADASSAQITNENTRGVRVLEAEPEAASVLPPAPAPTPKPVVRPAPAPMPTPVIKFCERPFATTDFQLTPGATRFDRDLAAKLALGKTVTINLPQPYKSDASPPAALSPWLSEVKAGGGEVTIKEYCASARGGLGSFLATLFGIKPASPAPYRSARKYNATLHADALDKVITQVEFTPKSGQAR